VGHTVVEAADSGWERLTNGELLKAAERAGFDILLTNDKNIQYQQKLTGRTIAFVVLGNSQWPVLRHHASKVIPAVDAATPGSSQEVEIPFA